MTLASLFDGISGFPWAASKFGIKPIWASEIGKFPIAVSKHHFPSMKHYGDVTKIDGSRVEPVDIVTFGFPCQDLSVAGKREGFEGKRSILFYEATRIIKEMRDATRPTGNVRPRYAVFENVPGLFSHDHGETFRLVIEEMCNISGETVTIPRPPDGKWTDAGCIMGVGFSFAWRVLDAKFWGVPQRRKRIFAVLDLEGERATEIFPFTQSLSGNTSQGRTQGEGTTTNAERGFNESGNGYWMPGVGTIRTNGSRPTNLVAGFNGWKSITGSIQYGDTCPTIETTMPPNVMCLNDQCGSVMDVSENVTATLRAQMHGNIPAVIIPINDQATHENGHCNGSMVGKPGDPMYSLTAQDRHAMMIENHPSDSRVKLDESGTCQTLTSRMGTDGGNVPMLMAHGQANAEIIEDCSPALTCNHEQPILFPPNNMKVRRLIPWECELLQGFPPKWTDIPGASDSARYKSLGNSVAIPCVEFIMSRIAGGRNHEAADNETKNEP